MAGIYIHIPFCKSRCIYCDFYSSTLIEKKDTYVNALCSEITLRKDYLKGEQINTIYWGGGTPSQLEKAQLEKIFETLNSIYDVSHSTEVTIETNPDDLSPSYLGMLQELGFNRLSIGVQTFQDDILKFINRRHNAAQVTEAINDAHNAGFTNISIDLIYGLPKQNMQIWKEDIERAINTGATHISAYGLTYENGTQLHKLLTQKAIPETKEDEYFLYYEYLVKRLKEAGFIHYEISNFCRPGMYSRHNSSYWNGINYIGCGPSAHSYNGVSRQWNVASLNKYIKALETGEKYYEIEHLSKYTQYNDYIITSLRTIWGLNLEKLHHDYGEQLYKYCLSCAKPYIEKKLLIIDSNILKFDEQSIFISDGIMSDLLWID